MADTCIEVAGTLFFRGSTAGDRLMTTIQRAELQVRSAKLHGFLPFPTYNDTIAAPSKDTRGLCSILSADGELVVLQALSKQSERDSQDRNLRIVKVLPPIEKQFSSFCQCWLHDGSVIASTHDRSVIFYSSDEFQVQKELQVRYAVTSMDMIVRKRKEQKIDDKEEEEKNNRDEIELVVLAATAFGAFVYVVMLSNKRRDEDSAGDKTLELLDPVVAVHAGVAMCMVKFSSDGHIAAIGSVDGRLFVRTLESHDERTLATFGTLVFSRVLESPRVTGLCFSTCSTKLVVSTRKGNIYVCSISAKTGQWRIVPSCSNLSRDLTLKAGGKAGAHSAAPTLVSSWGPVFVVCPRGLQSRLEIYDFLSGNLLHSLQFTPSIPVSSLVSRRCLDQHVVTGVCSMRIHDGGPLWLLCHDESSTITGVEWPFLDFVAG